MSFYVKRSSTHNPTGVAFVGPIRSEAQANRERDAWLNAGHTATVLVSSSEVRAEVRAWAKARTA